MAPIHLARIFNGGQRPAMFGGEQRQVGPLSQRLFDELSAIQRGLKPDRHGWMVEVDSSQ